MSAQGLPIGLLTQFVPRPPAEYLPPTRPHRTPQISCIGSLVNLFEKDPPPVPVPFESPYQRRSRLTREKKTEHDLDQEERIRAYRPMENAEAISDPYKTLFIGRLSYSTTERSLRHIFEEWGHVREVKVVRDKDGKSRGFAFLEYENERDLKYAYQHADGIRIDGRHILVDVERGRTVVGWLPRRLGGGKGPGRIGYDPKKQNKRPPVQDSRHYDDHPSKRQKQDDRGDHSRYNSRKSSFNY